MLTKTALLMIGFLVLPICAATKNPVAQTANIASSLQDPGTPTYSNGPEDFPSRLLSGSASAGPTARYFLQTQRHSEMDKKIQAAASALRTAETEKEKADAEKLLNTLLGKDYDSRLQSYEDYLSGLEKKIVEMKSKLEKRRAAKADMIKLRIKVLAAEAEELGWPARMSSNRLPSLLRQNKDSIIWVK